MSTFAEHVARSFESACMFITAGGRFSCFWLLLRQLGSHCTVGHNAGAPVISQGRRVWLRGVTWPLMWTCSHGVLTVSGTTSLEEIGV